MYVMSIISAKTPSSSTKPNPLSKTRPALQQQLPMNTLISGSAIWWRPSGGRICGWTRDLPLFSQAMHPTGFFPNGISWMLTCMMACRMWWPLMQRHRPDRWRIMSRNRMRLKDFSTTLLTRSVSNIRLTGIHWLIYIIFCLTAGAVLRMMLNAFTEESFKRGLIGYLNSM